MLLNVENEGRVKIRPAPNSLLMLLPAVFLTSLSSKCEHILFNNVWQKA